MQNQENVPIFINSFNRSEYLENVKKIKKLDKKLNFLL